MDDFTDSGSDWDSLSGDGPTLKTKSEIKSVKRKSKASAAAKSPKKPSHRFTDDDNGNTFKSVEFEDKSHLEVRSKQKNAKQKTKRQRTSDNENLPYLNFKAAEVENVVLTNAGKQISKKHRYETEEQVNNSDDSVDGDHTGDDIPDRILENNNVDLYGSSSHGKFEKNIDETRMRLELQNQYPASSICDSRKEDQVASLHFTDKSDNYQPELIVNGVVLEKRYHYEKPSYDFYSVSLEEDAVIPKYADKMERHIRRVIKEFFGLLQIILNVIVIFILELFKFIFKMLIQKLTVGLLKVTGDFFLKPFSSTLFNSILQPLLIFQWNILIGLKQLLQPIILLVGDVMVPFATLLRSFRLFEYKSTTPSTLKEI